MLNLPVGIMQQQAVPAHSVDVKKIFQQLMGTNFNGYLVVTIEGFAGIEEGVFLIKNGVLFGALYEYSNFDITVFGSGALQQAFNALAADYAVFDVCELSKQQVELIGAFNEKTILPQPIMQKDVLKYFKTKFEPSFAQATLQQVLKKEESKYDVFKKIGLTDITK